MNATAGLDWLPDELVFSYASRYHLVACHVNSRETCLALFGHHRAGSAHDFPSRLDDFAARHGGRLGEAADIIREHTILPFFLPTQTPDDAGNAVAAMRSPAIGALKAQMGLLATGFGARHLLKACPKCMQQDRRTHGPAYWHRVHQVPGVWTCPTHHEPLQVSLEKATGVGRFLWNLPSESTLRSLEPIQGGQIDQEVLLAMSDCAVGMLRLPQGFHFDPGRLAATHRASASDLDIISPAGRLRHPALGPMLSRLMHPLLCTPDFQGLGQSEAALASRFTRLFHEPRSRWHPLMHCFLALALHGSWNAFMTRYAATSVPGVTDQEDSLQGAGQPRANAAGQRKQLLHQMLEQGSTPTAAARAVGVAVATSQAWASESGQKVLLRPKKFVAPLRERAIRALQEGAAKQEVAADCGVSVETITKLLRTLPGLRLAWHSAVVDRRRELARADWIGVMSRHPRATVKEIRRYAPAAFAWLYRNDRAWLTERSNERPEGVWTTVPRIDWDRRDELLQRAVSEAGLTLIRERPPKRITLALMCAYVPALKPLIGKLDRLPLTRAALDRVLRPPVVVAAQRGLFD